MIIDIAQEDHFTEVHAERHIPWSVLLGREELRRVDVQLDPKTEEDNSCFFGSLKLQSKML